MGTYILQMLACSGILYGYYYFFLRDEKFHQYNRFYLLTAMFCSLILPIIKIPIQINSLEKNPTTPLMSLGENVVVTAQRNFDYTSLLIITYLFIIVVLVFKLVFSIAKIVRIKRSSCAENFGSFIFIKTSHPDAPFSFFRWLFWHERTKINSKIGLQILKHEAYHIHHYHSYDLLLVEIILCFFWFNPFFFLYRKEIKTIQEFLADQAATEGSEGSEYAQNLIMQIAQTNNLKLINPFFHNHLKRRIAMLLHSKKSSYQWLRKVLVLPVFIVITSLTIFSFKSIESKKIVMQMPNPIFQTTILDTNIIGTKTGKKVPQKKIPSEPEIFMKPEISAKHPGNWVSYLQRNLNANLAAENGAKAGNYTTITQFIVNVDGTLEDIKSLSNVGYGLDQEAIRVIKNSGKWTPALQNGRSVKSYIKLPITFQVEQEAQSNDKKDLATKTESTKSNNIPIFTKTEIDAKYPGNWVSYLQRNLNANLAAENGAKAGNYTTITQFIVNVDGTLEDIKSLSNVGYGLDQEAIRVIKNSGKWTPALQNGRSVKSYIKLPITFQVEQEAQSNDKKDLATKTESTKSNNIPIFTKTEIDAKYPGNWVSYLQRNLNANLAAENGAKAGNYTTITQFIVNVDGTLEDIKSLSNVGYGLDQEAIRIIKNSGKWTPALQNGRSVKSYKKLPITFQVVN